MRIGHGFDIHPFELGRPLILGGVHVPFDQGMQGHSDGDVILHALSDALLGAAALGDIGQHFPDTDPKTKGIDSRILLRHVVTLLKQNNFTVQNVDITVIAQVPKLGPYISQMRENIAKDLEIEKSCVNLKATTMEKLGPVGECKAIEAHAVVLLRHL